MNDNNRLEEPMPTKVNPAKAKPAKKAPVKKAAVKKAVAVKKASPAAKRAPSSNGRTPMSDAHKGALAVGRDQGRIVRRYLEALEAVKPRRGRKRTPEGIDKRLAAIEKALPSADPLNRLHLIQERLDLMAERDTHAEPIDIEQLSAEFVTVAAAYGERKGISYTAWRELNVPSSVLERAGIGRGS